MSVIVALFQALLRERGGTGGTCSVSQNIESTLTPITLPSVLVVMVTCFVVCCLDILSVMKLCHTKSVNQIIHAGTPSPFRLSRLVILRVGIGVHKFPCYYCDYMCAHVHIARS